jgi:5'-nucleotidase
LHNPESGEPIIPGISKHYLETNEIKIGFMGLIEEDWVMTQNKIKSNEYIYIDFISKAKELCKEFKEESCDIIIALTHMRTYNDK